ncbi:hypothetical protein P7H22_11075 [Paenibacillus larvae]|nr:hypothetical protein [Paenibacillus larvae]MDT2240774.1 hypothetical protein [Paenibacillus larvae]
MEKHESIFVGKSIFGSSWNWEKMEVLTELTMLLLLQSVSLNSKDNLYEEILNEFKVLEPIEIRSRNEVLINKITFEIEDD